MVAVLSRLEGGAPTNPDWVSPIWWPIRSNGEVGTEQFEPQRFIVKEKSRPDLPNRTAHVDFAERYASKTTGNPGRGLCPHG